MKFGSILISKRNPLHTLIIELLFGPYYFSVIISINKATSERWAWHTNEVEEKEESNLAASLVTV